MSHKKQHASHEDVSKRLKRAKGHLETVIAMIEDERECVDVARQLHAVVKALAAAKSVYIHDHIEHCLDGNHRDIDLDEIKEITKYIS
ncbi:metal-sensing transcriptional repressor [Bdellovibrio sp. 22V]|uniref:metal-sensing transcriptional repressor n=1 Tax=Bdellovibrio TaxID=958 RepID=UPI00254358A2|nr:metal-sensing transcriptional repressor [Bdellovibrio sp. 22V]WII70529.1 metal-sensing transcriptional repressor [Bdellovibrio sp. 22V]